MIQRVAASTTFVLSVSGIKIAVCRFLEEQNVPQQATPLPNSQSMYKMTSLYKEIDWQGMALEDYKKASGALQVVVDRTR